MVNVLPRKSILGIDDQGLKLGSSGALKLATLTLVLQFLYLSNAYFSDAYANFNMLK